MSLDKGHQQYRRVPLSPTFLGESAAECAERPPWERSGQNCPVTSFDSNTSGVMLLMCRHWDGAAAPGQQLQAGTRCQT